jgi:POT family proton-dependent oligopeptide transporter
MSIELDVKTVKTGFWHFPKTFYAVLLIEFWERFAFYGLQSVAVIYFIQKYNLHESDASNLFSSFSALLYAMLVIGGLIGDKVLGLRRTYLLGIILFIIGYWLLSHLETYNGLYSAMGIILMGNVFFKTNANNYIGRCFDRNDPRLDSAFTYFYMSINVGSFIGLLFVPIVSKSYSYAAGLSLSAFSMICALITYFIFRSRFILSDNHIGKENGMQKNLLMILILAIALGVSYLFGLLLRDLALSKVLMFSASIIILIIYIIVMLRLPKNEAKGMMVALVLLIQAIVFWVLYMQQATSLTLFAYHNVHLSIFGYNIPAGSTQSFNGLFIILLSPIMANLYMFFSKKGGDLGIPTKYVIGIFITSLCFIILGFACTYFADTNYQISIGWLFLAYAFYSLGELLVSALGASMVAKLLPKRFGGFAQGIWYLSSAVGMKIGGQISSNAVAEYHGSDLSVSLKVFQHFFYNTGIVSLLIALSLVIFLRPLNKKMKEILANS